MHAKQHSPVQTDFKYDRWQLFCSSLEVLAVLFSVHCADYHTALLCFKRWHNAVIASTNDNPQSARLVRKRCSKWYLSEISLRAEGGCLILIYEKTLNILLINPLVRAYYVYVYGLMKTRSKSLNLAVLIFPGRCHPWFFSVEDSSHSSISNVGGNYCLLQKDTLRHQTSPSWLQSHLLDGHSLLIKTVSGHRLQPPLDLHLTSQKELNTELERGKTSLLRFPRAKKCMYSCLPPSPSSFTSNYSVDFMELQEMLQHTLLPLYWRLRDLVLLA